MAPLAMALSSSTALHQSMQLARRSQNSRRVSKMVVKAKMSGKDGDKEYYQGIVVPKEEDRVNDSYVKSESPVRQNIPDGGPPVAQREDGYDQILMGKKLNPETQIFGTSTGLADAMRFKGAGPEIINSRLAMLGFVLAASAESATGMNIFQQIQSRPVFVGLTVVLFTVASLVPILKGVPRKGNAVFTADAEILNGRLAMLGIAALFVSEFVKKSPIL